jgi:hypothetical protein
MLLKIMPIPVCVIWASLIIALPETTQYRRAIHFPSYIYTRITHIYDKRVKIIFVVSYLVRSCYELVKILDSTCS